MTADDIRIVLIDPQHPGNIGAVARAMKVMAAIRTTGLPVVGELTGSGIVLRTRPVAITTWRNWLATHPETKVLSLETGYRRDYGPGVVYNDYFASPDLMFPAIVRNEEEVKRKDYVFGIREFAAAKV